MSPKTEPDDLELLRAWQSGDGTAGDRLFQRHFDSVFRFFSGRLASANDVTDMVQKTFLACLESRDRWSSIERFRPFLLGVARNQLLMFLRYHQVRRGEQPHGSLQERWAASDAEGISMVAARRAEQRKLLVALRHLPLDLQITLELHYWEGFSTREIGEVMGISSATVKSRLVKARRLLDQQLGELPMPAGAAEVSLRQLGEWAVSIRGKVRE
ncbi:MAG: RNA polymerase sigma factor [Deltaproteobacteria bacterium]|nr:RNA polymerase sigma factor [Deltaproteobacteria bacterium]